MKNQDFQVSTFSTCLFVVLIFLDFCFIFSLQNLWVFGGRDLSILDPFLVSFSMVLASIWLPEPSKRPSRRQSKKSSNFDTQFSVIFDDFGDLLGHSKWSKNVTMHLGGGPIFVPKADCEENGAPGCSFKVFWLTKLAFWQRFLRFFCIFLGSRSSSSTCQIGFPIMHLVLLPLPYSSHRAGAAQ